jgi:Fur family peroxide stress response transcriptional regulator
MKNYTDLLRAYNLKATPQRIEIASTLDQRGHITIDGLYEVLLNKFNSISLATIYKNINIMMEAAFIQEVKIPNAKSVFELTKESHSHLACQKCGEVEDIDLDLHTLNSQIEQISHFEVKQTNLVISGICKNCATIL